jgi:hypothetical protein
VSGRRWIDTALMRRIVVAEENAAAALEAMSRFAIAPQWLVYLPPTMSPVETSKQDGFLERPEEAFGVLSRARAAGGDAGRKAHGIAGSDRALP